MPGDRSSRRPGDGTTWARFRGGDCRLSVYSLGACDGARCSFDNRFSAGEPDRLCHGPPGKHCLPNGKNLGPVNPLAEHQVHREDICRCYGTACLKHRVAYDSSTGPPVVAGARPAPRRMVGQWHPPNPSRAGIPANQGRRPGSAIPREPHPAHSRKEVPPSTVIGQPTPGICGNPGVSKTRIPSPAA